MGQCIESFFEEISFIFPCGPGFLPVLHETIFFFNQARMRGSIDLDKSYCDLELLPKATDSPDTTGASVASFATEGDGAAEEHRVEVTRKTDGTSLVLCFDTAVSLQDWMKSIFDVQRRKATFSRLRHADDRSHSISISISSGKNDDSDDWDQDPQSQRRHSMVLDGGERHSHSRRRSTGAARFDNILGSLLPYRTVDGERRRRNTRPGRGSLESPPVSPLSPSRGRVPSSWAEDIEAPDVSPRPTAKVGLGKASERLAHLPRGGRAPGDGINSGSLGLDVYGAFTTAHSSIYEGWTRGLQPHGWGRMTFANGDSVEGWWEHDVLEGSGEHTSHEEGWTYRGGYVAGKRHGPGRLTTAQGDVWECEWRHGVVAPGSNGTHVTVGGEQYQGGCAPSADNPEVPCRSGHGRLRRRNGEHVETQFRAGRAVDGAKGVVRFRNGAIFFGEFRDARPHG